MKDGYKGKRLNRSRMRDEIPKSSSKYSIAQKIPRGDGKIHM